MTRGRGRPAATAPAFGPALQAQFLAEVAAGTRLGDAVRLVGISPALPSLRARQDKEFARALAEAKKAGRAARGQDHGEYAYNVLGHRDDICKAAAAAGRARRRAAEKAATADSGPEKTSSPISLPLRSLSARETNRAA